MSRLFVTGDTHRLQDVSCIDTFDKSIGNSLTAKDYLIIVGDFGGIWTGQKIRGKSFPWEYYADHEMHAIDDETQAYWENKLYSILFIDGNHENHDALNLYPVEEWNGGKIHRIYKNTIHLMRGQVFTINGKTCFTMGGAQSTDLKWRKEGFSWWKSEIPSEDEFEEALKALEIHEYSVDYIFTHCCPESIIGKRDANFVRAENILTRFLSTLITAYKIQYKEWYFGHYHIDMDFDNMHCIYNRIIELKD